MPDFTDFKPSHRIRDIQGTRWTEVVADRTEPQTYYDKDGNTIYAGIWFQNMVVERMPAPDYKEILEGWADWFEHNATHVGGQQTFTADEVAILLRGPVPFGKAQGTDNGS